jgi:hypothetical protein
MVLVYMLHWPSSPGLGSGRAHRSHGLATQGEQEACHLAVTQRS